MAAKNERVTEKGRETICSYHVTYELPKCQGLFARNRYDIRSLSDCNGTRTHNHLVRNQTLNHLAKLVDCSFTNLVVVGLSLVAVT